MNSWVEYIERKNKRLIAVLHLKIIYVFNDDHNSYHMHGHNQGRQENFWAPGQKETWPPPQILQIMILKLSPPRCVISKESVQQK